MRPLFASFEQTEFSNPDASFIDPVEWLEHMLSTLMFSTTETVTIDMTTYATADRNILPIINRTNDSTEVWREVGKVDPLNQYFILVNEEKRRKFMYKTAWKRLPIMNQHFPQIDFTCTDNKSEVLNYYLDDSRQYTLSRLTDGSYRPPAMSLNASMQHAILEKLRRGSEHIWERCIDFDEKNVVKDIVLSDRSKVDADTIILTDKTVKDVRRKLKTGSIRQKLFKSESGDVFRCAPGVPTLRRVDKIALKTSDRHVYLHVETPVGSMSSLTKTEFILNKVLPRLSAVKYTEIMKNHLDGVQKTLIENLLMQCIYTMARLEQYGRIMLFVTVHQLHFKISDNDYDFDFGSLGKVKNFGIQLMLEPTYISSFTMMMAPRLRLEVRPRFKHKDLYEAIDAKVVYKIQVVLTVTATIVLSACAFAYALGAIAQASNCLIAAVSAAQAELTAMGGGWAALGQGIGAVQAGLQTVHSYSKPALNIASQLVQSAMPDWTLGGDTLRSLLDADSLNDTLSKAAAVSSLFTQIGDAKRRIAQIDTEVINRIQAERKQKRDNHFVKVPEPFFTRLMRITDESLKASAFEQVEPAAIYGAAVAINNMYQPGYDLVMIANQMLFFRPYGSIKERRLARKAGKRLENRKTFDATFATDAGLSITDTSILYRIIVADTFAQYIASNEISSKTAALQNISRFPTKYVHSWAKNFASIFTSETNTLRNMVDLVARPDHVVSFSPLQLVKKMTSSHRVAERLDYKSMSDHVRAYREKFTFVKHEQECQNLIAGLCDIAHRGDVSMVKKIIQEHTPEYDMSNVVNISSSFFTRDDSFAYYRARIPRDPAQWMMLHTIDHAISEKHDATKVLKQIVKAVSDRSLSVPEARALTIRAVSECPMTEDSAKTVDLLKEVVLESLNPDERYPVELPVFMKIPVEKSSDFNPARTLKSVISLPHEQELCAQLAFSHYYTTLGCPHFLQTSGVMRINKTIPVVMTEQFDGTFDDPTNVFSTLVDFYRRSNRTPPSFEELTENCMLQTVMALCFFQNELHGMHNRMSLSNVVIKLADDTPYGKTSIAALENYTYKKYSVRNLGIVVKLTNFASSSFETTHVSDTGETVKTEFITTLQEKASEHISYLEDPTIVSKLMDRTANFFLGQADTSIALLHRAFRRMLTAGSDLRVSRGSDLAMFMQSLTLSPMYAQHPTVIAYHDLEYNRRKRDIEEGLNDLRHKGSIFLNNANLKTPDLASQLQQRKDIVIAEMKRLQTAAAVDAQASDSKVSEDAPQLYEKGRQIFVQNSRPAHYYDFVRRVGKDVYENQIQFVVNEFLDFLAAQPKDKIKEFFLFMQHVQNQDALVEELYGLSHQLIKMKIDAIMDSSVDKQKGTGIALVDCMNWKETFTAFEERTVRSDGHCLPRKIVKLRNVPDCLWIFHFLRSKNLFGDTTLLRMHVSLDDVMTTAKCRITFGLVTIAEGTMKELSQKAERALAYDEFSAALNDKIVVDNVLYDFISRSSTVVSEHIVMLDQSYDDMKTADRQMKSCYVVKEPLSFSTTKSTMPVEKKLMTPIDSMLVDDGSVDARTAVCKRAENVLLSSSVTVLRSTEKPCVHCLPENIGLEWEKVPKSKKRLLRARRKLGGSGAKKLASILSERTFLTLAEWKSVGIKYNLKVDDYVEVGEDAYRPKLRAAFLDASSESPVTYSLNRQATIERNADLNEDNIDKINLAEFYLVLDGVVFFNCRSHAVDIKGESVTIAETDQDIKLTNFSVLADKQGNLYRNTSSEPAVFEHDVYINPSAFARQFRTAENDIVASSFSYMQDQKFSIVEGIPKEILLMAVMQTTGTTTPEEFLEHNKRDGRPTSPNKKLAELAHEREKRATQLVNTTTIARPTPEKAKMVNTLPTSGGAGKAAAPVRAKSSSDRVL